MATETGRHAAPGRLASKTGMVLLALLALAASLLAGTDHPPSRPPVTTGVQLDAVHETIGQRLLDEEETRRGDWYVYGAAGPTTFDCSGLVYWAARQIGLRNWPRDTFELLAAVASGRLSYTNHPERGDLAFYGTGHVEVMTVWYHQTFGAQEPGTRVGWHHWSSWWHPTIFLRINW